LDMNTRHIRISACFSLFIFYFLCYLGFPKWTPLHLSDSNY
jgi:hypothetical protein